RLDRLYRVQRSPTHRGSPPPSRRWCGRHVPSVNDLDGLLKRLRAAGVSVMSARGEVVQLTPTVRNIIVDDPNGIHIELYEEKRLTVSERIDATVSRPPPAWRRRRLSCRLPRHQPCVLPRFRSLSPAPLRHPPVGPMASSPRSTLSTLHNRFAGLA